MATKKLSELDIGEVIKIRDSEGIKNYIVVHQGIPDNGIYDPNCAGTWLCVASAIENYTWDVSKDGNYATSDLSQWLNSIVLSKFSDIAARDTIKTVTIPYTVADSSNSVRTGKNGLSCKLFALSAREVGFSPSEAGVDGSKLDYFLSGEDEPANAKRITFGTWWWLRTSCYGSVPDTGDYGISVNSDGKQYEEPVLRPNSILFAFVANPESRVDSQNLLIENTPPTIPPYITIPDTICGGADTEISWSTATDPDGNLDGYIVERSYNGGSSWSQIYQGRETSTTTTIPFGTETVMFRVQAYDTYGEKSGWRTSANKTVVNNRAPAAPPSISVPLKPAGGEKLTVTWTASTDADGNLEGYELERQWDGAGAFTQIYKGAALSFQDDIPKGEHTSVVYRVRAYDSFAAYSSYTASQTRQIDNNTAPVIACDLSGDLGEKSEGFSIQYTIKDAEKQEVTVVERVGDLVKRTYKPTLNQQNTFEVTGEYFQKILNGAQTVQIVATDSAGKSSTLSLTFTKKVHKAVITLSEPLAVEEQITVAVLAITGKIPADATQLIELTNNGNDPEPVWEDATADVKAGRNYVFENKSQSAGWAFNFRVTVERGESGEDGNIVSIQGGFQ